MRREEERFGEAVRVRVAGGTASEFVREFTGLSIDVFTGESEARTSGCRRGSFHWTKGLTGETYFQSILYLLSLQHQAFLEYALC